MAFKKGESGNPGGRPRLRDSDRQLKHLARAQTVRAFNKLSALIDDPDGRIACMAASAVLDRGWGKPTQTVEGRFEHEHTRLTYAERVAQERAADSPAEASVANTVQ